MIGLKTAASGVSIVALGTSVPDTFASRTAALQDEHADAAIGNITGWCCLPFQLTLNFTDMERNLYYLL